MCQLHEIGTRRSPVGLIMPEQCDGRGRVGIRFDCREADVRIDFQLGAVQKQNESHEAALG